MKPVEFFESTCFTPSMINGQAFFHNRYANFSFPKHFHDDFLIQLNINGRNKFYCNGSYYDAVPGDIVLINPGEVHNGTCPAGEKLEYRVFYVEPGVWTAVLKNNDNVGLYKSFSFRRTVVKDGILSRKISAYFNSLAAGAPDEIELHEKYADILVYIAGKYSSVKPADLENNCYHKNAVGALKEYIHENLDDKLSLNKLSKMSAISPFHLLRIFTKQTGITLHQFILVKRIEKAKLLLKKKEPISDVAYSLGFSDQSHFIRSFKKMSGITPGEFQKNYLNFRRMPGRS